MIDVTDGGISLEELVGRARRSDAGAIVVFIGTVRDDGIVGMDVESYREAALPELERIQEEAIDRFRLRAVEVVHRVGRLCVGDVIVAIVCSAAHRDEAFLGCRYIIDELKSRVPIWKKEVGDGWERWIGLE